MFMHLHIVSFNVPWPADYGGVIDVYHRIVALSRLGVHIHLHCYTYGRVAAKELERWCDEVCYYPRETGLLHQLGRRPYIVSSRCSRALLQRLCQDDYPVLLEGLHCCLLLEHLSGTGRRIIVRAHNVEHDYYQSLARAEKNIYKRLFFLIESHKLRRYEPVLRRASAVLAISQSDAAHFSGIGCRNVLLIPPSHGHVEVKSSVGRGEYVLYHGNLSVAENINAVRFILENVVKTCPYQFVIAGRDPDESLKHAVAKYSNVRLVVNPDDVAMLQLIQQAQVNLLITDQATGVKLKLVNALYDGRHCLVNSTMVQGTRLGEACTIADTPEEIRSELVRLMGEDFTETERQRRIEVLKRAEPEQDLCSLIL